MLITLITGKQDRGTRATLALSWGCAALAMGQNVTLFLTMDGTVWASEGYSKGVLVEGFEALEVYFEQFIDLGGELLVCAPCSQYYCSIDGEGIGGALRKEAQLSGLATVVSRISPTTKTVTF